MSELLYQKWFRDSQRQRLLDEQENLLRQQERCSRVCESFAYLNGMTAPQADLAAEDQEQLVHEQAALVREQRYFVDLLDRLVTSCDYAQGRSTGSQKLAVSQQAHLTYMLVELIYHQTRLASLQKECAHKQSYACLEHTVHLNEQRQLVRLLTQAVCRQQLVVRGRHTHASRIPETRALQGTVVEQELRLYEQSKEVRERQLLVERRSRQHLISLLQEPLEQLRLRKAHYYPKLVMHRAELLRSEGRDEVPRSTLQAQPSLKPVVHAQRFTDALALGNGEADANDEAYVLMKSSRIAQTGIQIPWGGSTHSTPLPRNGASTFFSEPQEQEQTAESAIANEELVDVYDVAHMEESFILPRSPDALVMEADAAE